MRVHNTSCFFIAMMALGCQVGGESTSVEQPIYVADGGLIQAGPHSWEQAPFWGVGDDSDTDTDEETDTDIEDDWEIPEGAAFSELWGMRGEKWDHDRFGDFSYAGYRAGEEALPEPERVTNVRDFGAVGDGTTNDLSAFQAAIRATSNGALWVPKGRYLLQSSSGIQLNIDTSHVVIRGEGSGEDGTVLLVDSPAQCDDSGNSGDCYGTGVFRFGKEGHYGSGLSAPLTRVRQAAYRGDNTLVVDSATGIEANDFVILHLAEDSAKSLGRHLMAEESVPNAKDYNDDNESNYYWPVQVTHVVTSGGETTLTLKQPLRVDVRMEWSPKIRRPRWIEEVGLEHLRVDFKDLKHASHFSSNAYNAVDFTGVVNGWIRDVAIRDSDLAIWLDHTKHITMTDIQILPRVNGASGGHHGITLYRTADSMLEHFTFDTEYVHDIILYGHSNGNVVRLGHGQNLNIDFHTRLPHENLISCVDFGKGTRPYKSAGPGGRHHSAGREVFWGNYSRNWTAESGDMPLPDGSNVWAEFQSTFVSAEQTVGTSSVEAPTWGETVPSLYPCDLFAAQRRLRGL